VATPHPAPPRAAGRYSVRTPLGRLRLAGRAEVVSLALLVGVAVPLKHLAGDPALVRVLGPVHGVLFVCYFVFLAEVLGGAGGAPWPPRRAAMAVFAGLLPFGPLFLLDPLLDHPPASAEPRAARVAGAPPDEGAA
jgi:integral membrane protein